VYCASGYDAVHPSQGDTGRFQDFAVGEGSSLDMGTRGISTIFVKANCAIKTYEEENFGGRSWIWAGGETDTIYWTWEMAAITDNIEWNDRTKSYKCECQRMYKESKNRKIRQNQNLCCTLFYFFRKYRRKYDKKSQNGLW